MAFRFGTSILVFGILLVLPRGSADAVDTRLTTLRVFDTQTSVVANEAMVPQSVHGGAHVATGDLNGDGTDEIVIGAGYGSAPLVWIYSSSARLVGVFSAYGEYQRGGVTVASGDLNGDGVDEIITGTGFGGGPHVRVFDKRGSVQFTPGFYAYDPNFRGGVFVAAGDVNGDGKDEIITGAGPGGGPHVRTFNRYGSPLAFDLFPFALNDPGGVVVATANVDGGAEDEIIVGRSHFGPSLVKVYRTDAKRTILGSFNAYADTYKGGVTVAGGDVDHDGYGEIIVGTVLGGGPQVRVFEAFGSPLGKDFFAYENEFRGGVRSAFLQRAGKRGHIATVPGIVTGTGRTDVFQYVDVDLSEQTLRLYRNRTLEWSTAISGGVAQHPTPEGEFLISAMIPLKDYEWTYGPDHPDNYDLDDVPWNMRFFPHYYLHGTYWHNNFGTPMSHGCVNLSIPDAERVYRWASVGTLVHVHQ